VAETKDSFPASVQILVWLVWKSKNSNFKKVFAIEAVATG
jgi:hypothetical protein